MDDDGIPDYAVTAPGFDGAAGPESGKVYVVSGATGAWIHEIEGEQAFGLFGTAVVAVTDVNADGVPDLLISAPNFGNQPEDFHRGRAYVYSGADGSRMAVMDGEAPNDAFGTALVFIPGPTPLSGYAVVGAPAYDCRDGDGVVAQANCGRVYAFAASGLRTGAPSVWRARGQEADAAFGSSLTRAGLVDLDAVQDFAVGSPGFGGGLGRVTILSAAGGGRIRSFDGEQVGSGFGTVLAGGEDLTGDGAADLFIGAPSFDVEGHIGPGEVPVTLTDVGKVYVYDAVGGGLLATDGGRVRELSLLGQSSHFAGALRITRDLTGDGVADVLVGADGAAAFLERAEADLLRVQSNSERQNWVHSTYITHDTEVLAAQADEQAISTVVRYAEAASQFDDLELPYDTRRRLERLKLNLTLPAPPDPEATAELTRIAASMQGTYGKGKYCPEGATGDDCYDLVEMGNIFAESRDPKLLLDLWQGWRTVSPSMRPEFERYVQLANAGAQNLGFADLGAMWRSKYDMSPEAFAAELDRLWQQVRPLYEALHCHVRAKLAETYGTDVVAPDGPIPAHLLGNMWAQTWSNIYPLVAPPEGSGTFDLTERLRAKGVDERGMVRYGEGFFTSLGFDPLPETFWERSLFRQPRDRDVVCHASAWDIDWEDDLRLKMCVQINAEDFSVVHHELGHNFYQRAYKTQPVLYRDSANDGFHEALGDTVALSVTPAYLVQLGFIDQEPDASADLGLLMRMALDKVAFLPFGLLIDQWRWKVFSGEITPEQYNTAWWQLREKYQGIAPPVARSEQDFDPGAKYHVPANVPYTRYFLADILQFQFHRGLCQAAGYEGPLNRCSVYGNDAAGERLRTMMAMGASRPWPEALEVMTGQKEMDATAILDYFAPLKAWLDEQNQGRVCGWGG
ncbi:MAG: M2 family metallopeptidase [Acidobacteria bacterium]|nr:M2 family metallopeptidase [Acidobacteriota bacterium]